MDDVNSVLRPVTEMPDPQYVMSAEGHRIATYSWGDLSSPTILAVHGFASSARDNWANTGWVRDLTAAGFRVLAIDQRGHGMSDKPHDPAEYSMATFVSDLLIVMDTHLVDEVGYLGYSLGGRVGWHLMATMAHHVGAGVLGGIPDGLPLSRLDLTQAKAYLDDGTPITDPVSLRYVTLAERLPHNDLRALVALAEGMRAEGEDSPRLALPQQPTLVATGSLDPILDASRDLATALPDGAFIEVPARHHINAPGSRLFREAGVNFFTEHADLLM